MFDKKDTAQMLKDIMEKQAYTITELDILHRQLVDSDENLTFRYSAILNTLVKILDRLDAAQRKQDNEGCYIGGPRGVRSLSDKDFLFAGPEAKIGYIISTPTIQEIQEIRDNLQKLRDDLLKPRVPGAYSEMRCTEPNCPVCADRTPPPPKEPRLCETFVQFMAEPVVNRAYIYYHLTGGYNLTNKNMDVYLKHNTNLYDCPAFVELLRETPVRCIL